MGFSLKKAAGAIASPVKAVAKAVNPVAQAANIGKVIGVDTTALADNFSGGAASKFLNVSDTLPDLLKGNSVRDNLGDAVSLFQQGQGAAAGLVNQNGSFNFGEIFSAAKEMANRKNMTSPAEEGGYYYSTPNIVQGSDGINPWLLYGGIGAALFYLILKR